MKQNLLTYVLTSLILIIVAVLLPHDTVFGLVLLSLFVLNAHWYERGKGIYKPGNDSNGDFD